MQENLEKGIEKNRLTTNWIKERDFSTIINIIGADLIKRIEYTRVWRGIKQRLLIGAYKQSNGIKISFESANDKEMIKAIESNALSLGLPIHTDVEKGLREDITLLLSADKKILASYLEQIDAVVSLKPIKAEIFKALDLKAIVNQKEFYEQQLTLVEQGKIKVAIEKAIGVEEEDVLWRLGQLCEEQEKLSEALEIYQAIPESNVDYYSKANERASEIIDWVLETYEKKEVELSEEEVDKYREFKIRFRLRAANQKEQPVTDRLCDQFAGGTGFGSPVTNIRVDEDTVINLLKQIKDLRKELALKSGVAQASTDAPQVEQSPFIFQSVFVTPEKAAEDIVPGLAALTIKDETQVSPNGSGSGLNLN